MLIKVIFFHLKQHVCMFRNVSFINNKYSVAHGSGYFELTLIFTEC